MNHRRELLSCLTKVTEQYYDDVFDNYKQMLERRYQVIKRQASLRLTQKLNPKIALENYLERRRVNREVSRLSIILEAIEIVENEVRERLIQTPEINSGETEK